MRLIDQFIQTWNSDIFNSPKGISYRIFKHDWKFEDYLDKLWNKDRWWKDYHVHWNPEEYGNVSKVRIPSNTLWKPDVKLYNFADVRDDEKRDANLVVESDGSILWIPQAIFKSTCSIDTRLFPFDVQKCDIKLGTWTYDGSKIDLDFIYEGESGFEMTDYVQSNEWDIVRTWAKKHVVVYKCCPEPYIDLTFSLSIRRKPAFYGYILILPCMLLSSLTLVLFWIPFGSPAKMILGMNIFVAFFVLLLLLSESTPKAASTIPLIGVYYCLNMILITVSTFLCVLVVNLSYHGYVTRVPSIVRKIMLGFLAHVLCVTKAKRKIRKPDNLLRKIECRQENGDIAHQKQDASSPLLSEHYTQEEVKESVRIATLLEREVKEIKNYLQRLEEKRIQKEENDCITQEWIQVALVLDRIFFVLYVILIIVSVVAVFGNAVINSPPVKNN
ncbi:hypothetical protein FSP39_004596 [Pinctada imbricata]|uniref:Uncharacterized protein n=1 Tax=Pinctada imbricata TaxID=66713 RepID=A0AA89C8E5_PINIB|nr:hypothetical protein FSP39_004596 [Pinctada imbricata]